MRVRTPWTKYICVAHTLKAIKTFSSTRATLINARLNMTPDAHNENEKKKLSVPICTYICR